MSIKQINPTVEAFLTRPNPEVLVLKGRWGVGKSHYWRKVVTGLAMKRKLGLPSYTYVSLFGLGGLHDLRIAMLVESRSAADIALDDPVAAMKSNGRRFAKHLRGLPKVKDFAPMVDAGAFLFLRDTLICLDDIERRSKSLSMADLLGLVSHLKEERGCKVCLILNDDALEDDARKALDVHGEKAFDTRLEFSPTPQEAFDIGVPKHHQYRDVIQECVEKLSVTNIRVVQRIVSNIDRLCPDIQNRNPLTASSVIKSTALLTWAYYDHEGNSLPFKQARQPWTALAAAFGADKKTEAELRWDQILGSFGIHIDDGIDQDIADFIEQGYYDREQLRSRLDIEDDKAEKVGRTDAYRAVWNLYYESFDNNESEFVDGLRRVFEQSIYLSPVDLDGAIGTLRRLGRDQDADALIDLYLMKNESNAQLLNLGNSHFHTFQDEALINRFAEALQSIPDTRTIEGVLAKVAGANGWNEEDVSFLASRTVDEYHSFFQSTRGELLPMSIRWCMRYRDTDPSTPTHQIYGLASSALRLLARESPLNRMRVERLYGLDMD